MGWHEVRQGDDERYACSCGASLDYTEEETAKRAQLDNMRWLHDENGTHKRLVGPWVEAVEA